MYMYLQNVAFIIQSDDQQTFQYASDKWFC